jgi:membrane-bound serine protease (ClpP class)
MLLVLGILALLAELSAPGGFVAGLVGVIMIALALYGLSETSANWFGLGLIVLAFILFVLELKTPTLGVAGVVGAIMLFVGLLVLFNTGSGEYIAQLSLLTAAFIAVPVLILVLAIARLAAKERLRQPITGQEQLIGKEAHARGDFLPRNGAFEGNAFVVGEIWKARSAEPIRNGDSLRIMAIKGLTLVVEPTSAPVKKAETEKEKAFEANGSYPM